MRKIIRTSLLILVLSCSAYAGDIPNNVTGNTPPPPPTSQTEPPASTTTQETADGDIPNNQPTESTATEVMLSLLQSVLSLF